MICFLEHSYEWDSQLPTRLDKGSLALVTGLCVLSVSLYDHTALLHKKGRTPSRLCQQQQPLTPTRRASGSLTFTPDLTPCLILTSYPSVRRFDANDFSATQDQDLDLLPPFPPSHDAPVLHHRDSCTALGFLALSSLPKLLSETLVKSLPIQHQHPGS